MGIWTEVEVNVTFKQGKRNLSVRDCIKEVFANEDVCIDTAETTIDHIKGLFSNKIKFRVEAEGEYAFNLLKQLNEKLKESRVNHEIEITRLILN